MFRLIAFDLDGTLVEFNIPFDEIRIVLGIKDGYILESILSEKDEKKRKDMLRVLEEYEIKSARNAKLAFYAKELLKLLKEKKIIYGIITRNSRKSVETISKNFSLEFDFVVTREDANPKPSSEPIEMVLKKFGVNASSALLVGDFLFDLIAGKNAGIKTALIVHERNKNMVESFKVYADYVFSSLKELAEFLEGKI